MLHLLRGHSRRNDEYVGVYLTCCAFGLYHSISGKARQRLTPAQIDRIIELSLEGRLSNEEIAAEIGCHAITVWRKQDEYRQVRIFSNSMTKLINFSVSAAQSQDAGSETSTQSQTFADQSWR